MSLADFITALDALEADALSTLSAARDAATVEDARVRFLGAKNGQLKTVQKQLASISVEDKPAAGKRLNEVKQRLQEALDSAAAKLQSSQKREGPRPDPTLPGTVFAFGNIHPVTQTIEHLKEIMGRMGFEVAEGPEVEDPWHNFVALNIPKIIRLAIRWTTSTWPRLEKRSISPDRPANVRDCCGAKPARCKSV